MKYRLKSQEIEAVRHVGPNTLNVVGKKGEQRAQPGDFVIITGDTPQDREVMPAKDFYEKYEAVGEDGKKLDTAPTDAPKVNAYGRPHFDSIEEAQAEAMLHYAPEEDVEGDTERPKSSEPFTCTIGNTAHLYSIQPSGVVAQIPVAMQDSTADFGYGTPAGTQAERFPATLANQNASAHETADDGLPISPFQRATAAEETPASTQGNVDNVPTEKPGEHPEPSAGGSPHEES